LPRPAGKFFVEAHRIGYATSAAADDLGMGSNDPDEEYLCAIPITLNRMTSPIAVMRQ
jgi:hypothetical protein